MENKSLNIILLLGVVVGIGVCFWRIVSGNTTDNEALLLSLILTIISILGSWIVSSFYSEYTFSKSLRTFALKASEKVNNLSNELYAVLEPIFIGQKYGIFCSNLLCGTNEPFFIVY